MREMEAKEDMSPRLKATIRLNRKKNNHQNIYTR